MDPVIQEMQRARLPIRPEVFARWCRHLRDAVQPQLDSLAAREAADAATAPAEVPAKARKREGVSA